MSIELAQAADAIHRFAAGQDLGDRALYESAFTSEAVLDFRQPALVFGAEVPLMTDREQILETAFTATTNLITTHTVTNVRWCSEADSARVHALVEAQHVVADAPERRLMLKNHYFVDVSAEDPGARITHMVIENTWFAGDPTVLFPRTP